MILDPQNMGLDTFIVELCALLAEIWRNIHFPVMASLICIKMVCGTFCQLFKVNKSKIRAKTTKNSYFHLF